MLLVDKHRIMFLVNANSWQFPFHIMSWIWESVSARLTWMWVTNPLTPYSLLCPLFWYFLMSCAAASHSVPSTASVPCSQAYHMLSYCVQFPSAACNSGERIDFKLQFHLSLRLSTIHLAWSKELCLLLWEGLISHWKSLYMVKTSSQYNTYKTTILVPGVSHLELQLSPNYIY